MKSVEVINTKQLLHNHNHGAEETPLKKVNTSFRNKAAILDTHWVVIALMRGTGSTCNFPRHFNRWLLIVLTLSFGERAKMLFTVAHRNSWSESENPEAIAGYIAPLIMSTGKSEANEATLLSKLILTRRSGDLNHFKMDGATIC